MISRTGTPQVAGYYILYEGLIGYLDGSLQEVKYASLNPDKPDDYTSTGGWLGFTDKYWLTALIPPQNEAVKARFTHTVEGGVDRYQTDYLGPASPCPPAATAAYRDPLFCRRQGSSTCSTPTRLGHPRFRLCDRFRLVLVSDQADLPDAASSSTGCSAISGWRSCC